MFVGLFDIQVDNTHGDWPMMPLGKTGYFLKLSNSYSV